MLIGVTSAEGRRSQPRPAKRQQYVPPSECDNISLLSSFFVYDNARANITISFVFSVGDFIATIELATKIRKEFVDAPTQLEGHFQ